ncbi:hypothetical protein HDV05_008155, partial [Chytridiales sp. JEL 0842]
MEMTQLIRRHEEDALNWENRLSHMQDLKRKLLSELAILYGERASQQAHVYALETGLEKVFNRPAQAENHEVSIKSVVVHKQAESDEDDRDKTEVHTLKEKPALSRADAQCMTSLPVNIRHVTIQTEAPQIPTQLKKKAVDAAIQTSIPITELFALPKSEIATMTDEPYPTDSQVSTAMAAPILGNYDDSPPAKGSSYLARPVADRVTQTASRIALDFACQVGEPVAETQTSKALSPQLQGPGHPIGLIFEVPPMSVTANLVSGAAPRQLADKAIMTERVVQSSSLELVERRGLAMMTEAFTQSSESTLKHFDKATLTETFKQPGSPKSKLSAKYLHRMKPPVFPASLPVPSSTPLDLEEHAMPIDIQYDVIEEYKITTTLYVEEALNDGVDINQIEQEISQARAISEASRHENQKLLERLLKTHTYRTDTSSTTGGRRRSLGLGVETKGLGKVDNLAGRSRSATSALPPRLADRDEYHNLDVSIQEIKNATANSLSKTAE